MKQHTIKAAESISLFCRLMIHEKKQLPIRSSEMGLLILAAKSETPVTPLGAAEYFRVSKPMIAAMVRSLQNSGFITKTPCEQDKRSFIIKASKSGEQLVETTYTAYYKTMRLLEQNMGADNFQALVSLLDRANTILWEDKNNG